MSTPPSPPDSSEFTQGSADPAEAPRRSRRGPSPEEIRATLTPLAEDERPTALRVAIGVALLVAVAVAVGALSVHELRNRGGSLPGALFLIAILVALARGMYERRYWAVLGFEGLLAFQIIVTSLALVVAETLLAAALCLLSVGLGGWLFWKLIRVMGRIQAGEPGRGGTLR
jgi:hypothetical protein